jgi:folate-binding protein YgfZ
MTETALSEPHAEDYGDWLSEYKFLTTAAGILDLSSRGRLCLTGSDRARYLHGQVTNDIKRLAPGHGCYAAITTAKGKMECDVTVYCLDQELLLDLEPGLAVATRERLERFIVADDVQVIPVNDDYGLLSVQGPRSQEVLDTVFKGNPMPPDRFGNVKISVEDGQELYLANHARLGTKGFDLFLPATMVQAFRDRLSQTARSLGGGPCGSRAFETARIEAGIPRYGVEMTIQNLPQECGIENSAISYSKGCYIGQEVLNRIHTMGAVTKKLCQLEFQTPVENLPKPNHKLFTNGKECGWISSITVPPGASGPVGTGYVRKEWLVPGTLLSLAAENNPGAVKLKRICGEP